MFKRLSIVGMGMMGASFARAALKAGVAQHITACDANPDHLKTSLDLGLCHATESDPAAAVQQADLVVLATPVATFEAIAKTMAPALPETALVTDLGSTKQSVISALTAHVPAAKIIPSHPISGSEKSGPAHFVEDLFLDKWAILCPLPENAPEDITRIETLWQKLGSFTQTMTTKDHDHTFALVSHLPHLISYALVEGVREVEKTSLPDAAQYFGGGFQSVIRLAGSDSVMWRDIFLNNKDAVLEMTGQVKKALTELETMIQDAEAERLHETLETVKEYYYTLLETRERVIHEHHPDSKRP